MNPLNPCKAELLKRSDTRVLIGERANNCGRKINGKTPTSERTELLIEFHAAC
jgi:hypothetical protein